MNHYSTITSDSTHPWRFSSMIVKVFITRIHWIIAKDEESLVKWWLNKFDDWPPIDYHSSFNQGTNLSIGYLFWKLHRLARYLTSRYLPSRYLVPGISAQIAKPGLRSVKPGVSLVGTPWCLPWGKQQTHDNSPCFLVMAIRKSWETMGNLIYKQKQT